VLDALEQACENGVLKQDGITPGVLEGFMSKFGRAFYGIEEEEKDFTTLNKANERIMVVLQTKDTSVVPFRKGQKTWSLSWI
jgi:dihydroorotase